ncbi:MAG: hypothetical protein DRP01_01685 [Archaeoglobales archaeon]|nr:MAG: hypothetical protein DRP01_01685 [Archaeoglobales archaeon]
MLCSNCHQKQAKWLVLDITHIDPLCDECLNEYLITYGEVNTHFISIDDIESLIREINETLDYWNKRYNRLLQEYHCLKKGIKSKEE